MDRISLPYWVIALLLLAYMGALFVIAWRGDHSARPSRSRRLRTLTYALSLGIYCTSWTYYGAVGTAERAGWEYLGVYIGPVLTFAFLFPLWRRVLVAAKREKAGSIADFLAARYSKSHVVGALVTAVAVVASLPYISLQLKSLTMAWYIAMGSREGQGDLWITLVLAGALAAFAVLFGASRIDLTEHRRGLSQAVAVESVVKLFGVILVAILALGLLWSGPGGTSFAAFEDPFAAHPPSAMRLVTLAVLSGAAIFCVPRQFQMGFVEAEDVDDVTPARWIFPLYLLLFSLAVIPIAVAGRLLVPASSDPDFYVLTLPLHHTGWAVTLVVLLGGFSAAAAMVVVETVALSAMVSNHLVLPLAERWLVDPAGRLAGRAIVILRQIAVLLIVALATGYFIVTRDSTALSSTGEISFAGAFQLAPALVAAVLWRRAHALGAIAGIIGGTSIWIVTLLLPQSGYGAPALLERAGAMLGVEDMLTLSAGLSLSTNVALLVGVSLLATPRLGDRIQAAAFVAPGAETARPSDVGRRLDVSVRDFKAILERFLGEEPVRRGLESFERQYGRPVAPDDPVSPLLARSGEKMLAGALGSTSARKVIGRALSNGRNDPEAVAWFLDEAAQAVQFNRDLLQATLDNLSQGVSVVDADLRLVAWNSMYVDMFGIPPSAVYASRPIADIIRLIAIRDERRADQIDAVVERRLYHLRRRQPYVSERIRPDGRVLKVTGGPIPGGGYVTSYTDVTDLRRSADALAEANEMLESRVVSRTAELAAAKAEAEAAAASKTRFLAAASHDVLQPLHAARLFVGSLAHDLHDTSSKVRDLLANADRSIDGAHRLLRALLELSRLEQGGVSPKRGVVGLQGLFNELALEFAAMAADRNIRMTILPTGLGMISDRDLLRSILQNLIGNALRYTPEGGRVVVGARRAAGTARVEIWDTGPGIASCDRMAIFDEFVRLGPASRRDGGAGLGLAIVRRLVDVLGHELILDSVEGRGTVFRLLAPLATATAESRREEPPLSRAGSLDILCVDNDVDILRALSALLDRWGFSTDCARSAGELATLGKSWDAALVDQHLDGELGSDLVARYRNCLGKIAIVTADPAPDLAQRLRAEGIAVLPKPIAPAALRAFLNGVAPN